MLYYHEKSSFSVFWLGAAGKFHLDRVSYYGTRVFWWGADDYTDLADHFSVTALEAIADIFQTLTLVVKPEE